MTGALISTSGAFSLIRASKDGRTTFSFNCTSGCLVSTGGISIGGCLRSTFIFGASTPRSIPGIAISGLNPSAFGNISFGFPA